MKLMYLGTAAAEGIPAVFCPCKACEYARKVRGKEIRTRSGAMVDDRIKIDFPPDAYMQGLLRGLNYADLHHILITHTHRDHFCPPEFDNCRKPFAQKPEGAQPITVYGNEKGRRMLRTYLHKGELEYKILKPYEPCEMDGYRVLPLKAVHAFDEVALFYAIEKNGQALLYAHDTDEFTEENLEFMKGMHFDIVSLDCTDGILPDCGYVGHMDITANLRMREKLMEIGAADEKTVFVANHFSHNGIAPYAEMQERLKGILVSYDGMTVEV